MKLTPFHARTLPLNRNQMWFNWDLHVVPDVYTDVQGELRATREAVSMGDMSPLSKYLIHGPDAARLVDRLVTKDTRKLDVGQVFYTPWCDERGKVIGDGLLFRLAHDHFFVTGDPHVEWFTGNAEGSDVAIEEATDAYGLLALQGPKSLDVMKAVTGTDWSDLAFSRIRKSTIAGARVLVVRQGFTGELGFELQIPAEAGPAVWDAVRTAGEGYGIRPVGEYAIDVARVEAGLLIVGADYTGAGPDRPGSVIDMAAENQASPYEIGLGQFVQLEKESDFIGKAALAAELERGGPHRRLVGLEIDWRAIVDMGSQQNRPPLIPSRVWWYPLAVRHAGEVVGRATSMTWAPTVNALVSFGHIPRDLEPPREGLSVLWTLGGLAGDVPARVVELPFLTRRRS